MKKKKKIFFFVIQPTWHDDVCSIGWDFDTAHWHNGQPFFDCVKPIPGGQKILQENGGHWLLHSHISQPNRSFKKPNGQFLIHWFIDGHDWHSHLRQPLESIW